MSRPLLFIPQERKKHPPQNQQKIMFGLLPPIPLLQNSKTTKTTKINAVADSLTATSFVLAMFAMVKVLMHDSRVKELEQTVQDLEQNVQNLDNNAVVQDLDNNVKELRETVNAYQEKLDQYENLNNANVIEQTRAMKKTMTHITQRGHNLRKQIKRLSQKNSEYRDESEREHREQREQKEKTEEIQSRISTLENKVQHTNNSLQRFNDLMEQHVHQHQQNLMAQYNHRHPKTYKQDSD